MNLRTALFILSAAFIFAAPLRADDTDNLTKARGMVKQVADPATKLSSDEKVALLNSAIVLVQEVQNHRLKGYRVEAIMDIRKAVVLLQSEDPDKQFATTIQSAEKELTQCITLVAAAPPSPQPNATPATPPAPAISPNATQDTPKPVQVVDPATGKYYSFSGQTGTAQYSFPALSAADATTVTATLKRLTENANKTPPGPVEDDVSSQHKDVLGGINQLMTSKGDKPVELREGLVADYGGIKLDPALVSSWQKGDVALAKYNVTLAPKAIENWNEGDDDSGLVFSDFGINQRIGGKIPADGKTTATFCLLKQQGQWKLHCVYFSTAGPTPDQTADILNSTTRLLKKPTK